MRDLNADLEIIRRTTPGEWFLCPAECGPEGQGVYHRETLGKICEVGDPYPHDANRPQENMEFVVAAHNGGWEEAIHRALAAEAKVAELEARLEAAMARALLAEARLREMRE